MTLPDGNASGDTEDDDFLLEYHTEALVTAICDVTLRVTNGQKSRMCPAWAWRCLG